HLDFRNDLERNHGWNFATTCDTETLLALFWAKAIEDKLNKKEICSILGNLDAFGIKPLFVAKTDEHQYIFASEIKAFPSNIKSISEVNPGTYLDLKSTQTSKRDIPGINFEEIQWFHFNFSEDSSVESLYNQDGSIETLPPNLAQRIRNALKLSVHRRLIGDVEVGVLLSGGLDSSLIAAIAAAEKKKIGIRIKTFNIRFDDSSSDNAMAKLVAAFIGSDHFEYSFEKQEVSEDLDNILWHLETDDQLIVRAAIPLFFLSKQIRKFHPNVKVLLCGEGADEIFAGYSLFQKYASSENALEFSYELSRRLIHIGTSELLRVDRCTMAHGLEARVPFLDLDFVSICMKMCKISWKMKTPEKWVLREAFREEKLIPDEVLERRKVEFATGVGEWKSVLTNFATKNGELESSYYRKILLNRFITEKNSSFANSLTTQLKNREIFRKSILGNSILSIDDCYQFMTNVLLLEKEDLIDAPRENLLNTLIVAMLSCIPFHNLTILTQPRRPPTYFEIREDMMNGIGGPCSVVNTFFSWLLASLSFDVHLVECSINGVENCHVGIIVLIQEENSLTKKKYFVDVANGKPYACPAEIPLDNERFSSIFEHSGLRWRLARQGDIVELQHCHENLWNPAIYFNPHKPV
ncbi:hypothetical protein HK096_002364, partial [Nowakowskiella sp. JEL0078]